PQEEDGVVHALGQTQELLRQFERRVELRSFPIKYTQSPQHREEPGCLAELLAQRARPRIGSSHFRGPIALGGSERSAQVDLEQKFLPGALGCVRESLQQL